jgi:pimeloyl-ACP methyl ester carboxylesterase
VSDQQLTIVLVHGAFANSSSWSKVIPLLQAKGCGVVAAHCPLSSLSDDVAAVERAISQQEGPVLLVGHSWGGAIITEAGIHPSVEGLVYIAAGAPDSGESFNDWWRGSPPAPGGEHIENYGPDGYVALTYEGFRRHFVPDLATDEIAVLHATQGPFNQNANNEPIRTAAWRHKPTWFLVGRNDQMLLFELEQKTAEELKATTLVLDSGHVPMLSHPQEVADFIATAARSVSRRPT